MDKKLIEELFQRVSAHFDKSPDGTKPFFELFVTETLVYRDELAAAGGEPLTVDEVRAALAALEEVLATNNITKDLSERSHALLYRWLQKLVTLSQITKD